MHQKGQGMVQGKPMESLQSANGECDCMVSALMLTYCIAALVKLYNQDSTRAVLSNDQVLPGYH